MTTTPDANVRCPECGASPGVLDNRWRVAFGRWEHGCIGEGQSRIDIPAVPIEPEESAIRAAWRADRGRGTD
jgi:hypothetical protein